MSESLPNIYLVRHGETQGTATGQHTSRTDLPLTETGEKHAAQLRARLQGVRPLLVLASPLLRARRTCELAGFGDQMEIADDLTEWGYGVYEGRATADIRKERPDWSLFRDGCPEGETAEQVGARADRIIARLHAVNGDAILFGHSHMFRVLTARWLVMPPQNGVFFRLSPASVSILSFEHTAAEPVISLWNDDRAG